MGYAKLSLFFLVFGQMGAQAEILWNLPATAIYSSDQTDVKGACIALESNESHACISFVEVEASAYNVRAIVYDGMKWTPSSVLGTTYELPNLTVGMDDQGRALAVWDSYQNSYLQLESSFFDGNQWSSLSSFQYLGVDYYSSFPSLSLNGNGFGLASWISLDNKIAGNTFSPTTLSWLQSSYVINRDELGLYAFPSSLAIANDQSVVGIIPSVSGIWATSFNAADPGSSLENSLFLQEGIDNIAPKIARDPQSGRSISIFQLTQQRSLSSGDTILSNDWSLKNILSLNVDALSFDIGLNGFLGEAAAVWSLSNGEVHAAVFSQGSWGSPVSLSSYGFSPSIAVFNTTELTTHAVAVWIDDTGAGGNLTVQMSEYSSEANSWSAPIALSQTSAVVENPRIEINSKGFALVCWDRQVQTPNGLHTVLEVVLGQSNE